jgi:hypothetical protein
MAAPMTSSLLLPAGISCPLICSSGFSAFHASTICLPQATSNSLFEYQMVMSPRPSADPPPPPPPQAVRANDATSTLAAASAVFFFTVVSFQSGFIAEVGSDVVLQGWCR